VSTPPSSLLPSTSAGVGPSAASTVHPMPPELEATLSLLSSHRTVFGYILISRGHPVSIIRYSGVVFEGEQGKRYAGANGKIVESVQGGLEEVHGPDGDSVSLIFVFENGDMNDDWRLTKDEVRFMRIRTKRHEIMISPGKCFGDGASGTCG
jgi:dynein light chain roadblock-type